MKRLLAGFFLIGFFSSGWAQSNECEQTLSQATEEFNAGHFYGIPALLKSCIERNNFSNEQKVRAYLLLCQAYLIIDDPIGAEESYLKLLAADPEYVATNEKDPVDVVYLSKKFTSTARFTPHIRVGINTSIYRPIYDISTQPSAEKVSHVIKPGLQLGAGLDWNINDNVAVNVGGILSSRNFKTLRENISANDQLTLTEKQFWLDIPIYLKYSDSKGRIRPFVYAGGALNLLLGSSATMVYENVSPGLGSQSNATGPNVKLGYNRKFLNRSVLFGGGARYKVGKDFLFVDARYMAGLTNLAGNNGYINDPGSQNPNQPITNDALSHYRYVDGYFRLDNISFSIGYIKPLYDPRKIKTRGTKSVSRKVRKQKKDEGK